MVHSRGPRQKRICAGELHRTAPTPVVRRQRHTYGSRTAPPVAGYGRVPGSRERVGPWGIFTVGQLWRPSGALPCSGRRGSVLHLGRILLLSKPPAGLLQNAQYFHGEARPAQKPARSHSAPLWTDLLHPQLHKPPSPPQPVQEWLPGVPVPHPAIVPTVPHREGHVATETSQVTDGESPCSPCPVRLQPRSQRLSTLPERRRHTAAGLLQSPDLEGALQRTSGHLSTSICPATLQLTHISFSYYYCFIALESSPCVFAVIKVTFVFSLNMYQILISVVVLAAFLFLLSQVQYCSSVCSYLHIMVNSNKTQKENHICFHH